MDERDRDLRIKYMRVFEETGDGEDVLMDICRFCGLDDLSYIRGDTHQTAFNEGKKSVAIYINDMLRTEKNIKEK